MADISRITTLDGITYNLKDQQARLTMAGATDEINGTPGAVPKPFAGDQNKLLQGDGTWTDTINIGRKANTTVGINSTAEGYNTTASAAGSHAEGLSTTASGQRSHAEGISTTAMGHYSHAEGAYTKALAQNSHAEGAYATASGYSSHAEGYYTTSNGSESHAEGSNTTAIGHCSHAEGFWTTASHKSQHVFGEYNEVDSSSAEATNRGNYVETVGNGTEDSNRSNARTLDWNGNEWLAGDLTINSNMSVANRIIGVENAIAIPSQSSTKCYWLDGLTPDHIVVAWNFSSSSENSPPCKLTIRTYQGCFTITNNDGTTTETIKPVFARQKYVTAEQSDVIPAPNTEGE